ncbi:hypothetical protein [Pelagimonas varians]|uniref:Uncharacterized protein n=1 Tax=Pelagimonas varians TaxID=696760 RepID=A0A238JYP6_9RHOB|nr:hypothetical protein [Pelagimonas varians]PYG33130.1 hypothetical protein C8N36_102125 [Pelagimonas varians]SMX35769.1 hypothetical protein PEV8663_00587 [Pelagimonas varians]
MKISFSPVRSDTRQEIVRSGDSLLIDGLALDFGPVSNGDVLPGDAIPTDQIIGDATRIDGALHLTLALPHGANAPSETLFPVTISMDSDGPIPMPPFNVEDTTNAGN